MRIKQEGKTNEYRILVIDDEIGIVDSLKVVLSKLGYHIDGETDPVKGVEMISSQHYDLIILDYLMDNLRGDQVVEKIRVFNSQVFILLLTGHKDIAPPYETIKALDIQGYCEKSDKFDQLILLVESAIKCISLIRKNKKFEEGLNQIIKAIPQIYQLQPLGVIMEYVLREILPFANSEDAFILVDVLEDENNQKSIFHGIGKFKTIDNSFSSQIQPFVLEQIGRAREYKRTQLMADGVVIPLINEEDVSIGVIYIKSSNYDEGAALLEIFAKQASASICNANLHSLVNTKKEELRKTYEELKKSYLDTIEALRLAVDAKDIYTRGHSDRVALYSKEIGNEMGLSDREKEVLLLGGQFHDIGKIGVKDDILLKPSRLTDDEYNEIKTHPQKGAHILSAISAFKEVISAIKHHHERFDGRGYPDGLKGEEIPLLARIVSVADAFDAMTSDRQYRDRLYIEKALEQLRENAGTQFDPYIVKVFIDCMTKNDGLWLKDIEETFV